MIEVERVERKVYDGVTVKLSPPDVANLRTVLDVFLEYQFPWNRRDADLRSWTNDLGKLLKEKSRE